MAEERLLCGWFAHCFNEATTTVNHPILGEVPTCERCAYFAKHGEFPKEEHDTAEGG